MNIENKYKIEEAASKDKTRPALHGVHVATVNGSASPLEGKTVAVATDGRIMALVPVDVALGGDEREAVKNGLVNVRPEALVAARKVSKKNKNLLAGISLNGKATVHTENGIQSFDYIDLRFPNFNQVLPKPTEKTFKLSFDVNNLVRLWKALGGEDAKQLGVTLTVGHDGSAVDVTRPVEVTVDGQGYGLLMQMRKS